MIGGEDDGTQDLMSMIMAKVRELPTTEVKLQCQLAYQRLVDYSPYRDGALYEALQESVA